MMTKTAMALCALMGSFALSGVTNAEEPAADAKPDLLISKDPRTFEPALSILFHAKSGERRGWAPILDAKMIFASLDKENPFQILGSEKKVTAEKVMEQLDASPGRVVVVAIEKEGAEEALLEPLLKHAEKFDVDVYRYGPVGKDYFPKVAVDPKKALKNDPRFFFSPFTLMWPGMENGKRGSNSLQDALMVYSSVRQSNHILGIDRQFTNDEIIKGLNDFYENWNPKDGEAKQPPAMIFAAENWGAGMDYEALKVIAEERKVDLYLYYVCNFDGYPTSTENDKRLAELIP